MPQRLTSWLAANRLLASVALGLTTAVLGVVLTLLAWVAPSHRGELAALRLATLLMAVLAIISLLAVLYLAYRAAVRSRRRERGLLPASAAGPVSALAASDPLSIYRAVTDRLNLGVAVLSPDLRFFSANQRLAEALGERDHDLRGRNCYEFAVICREAREQHSEPCHECPVLAAIRDGQ